MSRAQRRRDVADLITQRIVSLIHDEGANARAYALPNKGMIIVENPETGHRVVHEDIRFCCPQHCWYDIEQDAVTQILDQFGYMVVKIIKLNLPPSF